MKFRSIIALLALLLVMSPAVFSQSKETGAITGKVMDEESNPLPGVTLTLTSPNLMGARSVVTDAGGIFRFPALPPGNYLLKAELTGFGTVIRENMRLTTTVTLNADLTMRPSTVQEQVTVVAQSPTVDVKSTETASVTLTSEILRNMPYSNFTSDIVNMAPGVSNDVAYGASSGTGISYQMDGVGVADPDAGTAWVFLDSNIIEEAKIMGIGLPAEYGNFTGVIFNLVTKSGGNQFSGHMEFLRQGKKDDSPKGLWQAVNNGAYAEDFPDITSPLSELTDANFHLGGPILKDKLWFFVGLQYYRSKDYPTGFPLAIDYKQPRGFLKLTSQLTPSLNVNASFEYDDYRGEYRGGASTVSPEATVNQTGPEKVPSFSLTYILSPKTFFDVKAAMFDGYYYLEPRTGRDTAAHFYLSDAPGQPESANKRYFNSGYFYQADRSRFQANASVTHYAENFIKGNHDFKFGAEIEHSKVRTRYGYTGANHMYYTDYWLYGYDGPYLATQYEGYDTQTRYTRLEAFAQDAWQISDRVNISAGVRFSQNWGTIGGIGTVYKTNRIAPRLGFTFDIFGDKSTVLKAHYGQFTEGMFASYHDRMNTHYSDMVDFYWDPSSLEWVEYNRASHGKWTIDPNIKHPYMEQFTVGIERELFKDTSFSVTYINRTTKNIVGPYNKLAVYEPQTVTVSDLNKSFTVYELVSGNEYDWLITNIKKGDPGIIDNPYRKYWGFEFLVNKRFSNKWQLLASYVYSKSHGTIDNGTADDIGYGGTTYDPNFWINADGNSTYDPTHQIKVQASYQLPLGINFNAYFHANTGTSWTTRYRTGRFNQGRITFYVEPKGTNHYPMEKALDLRLEKTFTIAAKYRLGLIFDVFNVLNEDTINSWGTRIGYDWIPGDTPSTSGHDLYGLAMPRQARLGIRLIF
ncbi:MAG TPA: TonB-dependent receptor [Acidobacteriota bacterium]|nr:TonB-dependent receptor [Acidobacteriota bacterium]